MANYTCLLLDVDNTLLDFDTAERLALTDTLIHYDLPHDAAALATYHEVNRQLWAALARGQLNKNKLFAIRFARFLQAMGLPSPTARSRCSRPASGIPASPSIWTASISRKRWASASRSRACSSWCCGT